MIEIGKIYVKSISLRNNKEPFIQRLIQQLVAGRSAQS